MMKRSVGVGALGTAQTLAWGSTYYLPAILANPIAQGLGLSRTGDALSPCFENCIYETIRIAGPHPDGDKIEIVFDKGIESPRLRSIADGFTRILATHAWVRVIRFAKVQEILGLHGADVMATEAYWHGEQWIRQGDSAEARAHLRHMLANLRCESVILGRQEIEEVLRQLGPDAECCD